MITTMNKKDIRLGHTDEKNVFKTVILMTDFSEPARNAIKYAIDAFGEDVEYHLINAYYARTSSATLLDLNDILAKESEQGLKNEVNWINEMYKERRIRLKSHSVFGGPVDAIRKIKNQYEIDALVMGTKGASGIDSVLFGSVASNVIRVTKLPVISVPPTCVFQGFRNIVFASDGQNVSGDKVLEPLKKMQYQFNSEITLFSVVKEGQKIDWSKAGIGIENAHYETIEAKNIADAVTDFCQRSKTDLLAIVPKHTGFFERLFHHSISKELVEKAQLPILSLEND